MTKTEYQEYWKTEAAQNWETATYLKQGKQFVMSLFMLHLVLEKLLKAHWVKDNVDNFPPRIHDLQYLHNQSELDLPATAYDYLAIVNQWNIDTRYPDFKKKIYSIASMEYTEEQFIKVNQLRICLLEKL